MKGWNVVGANGKNLKECIKIPQYVLDDFTSEEFKIYELLSNGDRWSSFDLGFIIKMKKNDVETLLFNEKCPLRPYVKKYGFKWGLKQVDVVHIKK